MDLFTDREHGVEQAAATVEAALRQAGFAVQQVDEFAGLADIFPGMGQGLAEWIIASPDGQELRLQLAYFDRTRAPVTMDVGAVLDVEDVAGRKVCPLASRVEPRDYADTAAMLKSYPGGVDRLRTAPGPRAGRPKPPGSRSRPAPQPDAITMAAQDRAQPPDTGPGTANPTLTRGTKNPARQQATNSP